MCKTTKSPNRWISALLLIFSLLAVSACAPKPDWKAKNDRLIKEENLPVRIRKDIQKSNLVSNLEAGVVTGINKLPVTDIAPGVKARLYWGKGTLVAWLTLEPRAEIPQETLPSERLMFVMKGSIEQLIKGARVEMKALGREGPDGTHGRTPRNDFVYLEKAAQNSLGAGEQGADILEVYSPPRLDYLKKAGAAKLPSKVPEGDFPLSPTVEPGQVYDLSDIQFTELVPGAHSRLVSGRGAQLSFLRMDPGTNFAHHVHPEEQLMIVLRGAIDEIILDGVTRMEKGDVLLLPADMVHGGAIGDLGCDVLDVFWPPRTDYDDKRVKQLQAFHDVIPEEAKVELLADGAKQGPGLVFTEGPKWLNGKLYLSSMYFDEKWNGDPKKSALVEMDSDGTYRYISHGRMQTNGITPLANGNLAVCDMFGHRVIEMTTKGQIVRTLVGRYDGKSIDGPNDLVTDARGGIYFTDPQFTPDAKKHQPGRAVYYIPAKGGLIQVIGFNEFAMPNGILLSPDGKTLLVNNTYDNESFWNVDSDKDNWVWAYDVNEDGTVKNGRKFARLFLTPEVLDRKGRSSAADGMTIDENGGLYVATYIGLQVFNAKGEFLGIVNTPTYPVSCCFGGDDMKTLFIASYDKVYKIRTNVRGLKYGPQ
jgi:gluconolactonase